MDNQKDVLLQIVAGGMKPVLDEIRQRVTALEVENRALRERINQKAPLRPLIIRPPSLRPQTRGGR